MPHSETIELSQFQRFLIKELEPQILKGYQSTPFYWGEKNSSTSNGPSPEKHGSTSCSSGKSSSTDYEVLASEDSVFYPNVNEKIAGWANILTGIAMSMTFFCVMMLVGLYALRSRKSQTNTQSRRSSDTRRPSRRRSRSR